jgi:protein gp37
MPEKKNRPCYCPACWKEREVPIAPVQARQRVFCASLADVFEDNPQVGEWRAELFGMIEQTPNLDWLILTKRPEKIVELGALAVVKQFNDWLAGRSNVWIGTTVENQAEAEKRTKELGKVGPCVRFLSIEPMLEDLTIPMIEKWDWVIVGGESGQDFRPFHYQWARSIRDQCQEYGVPFFMKQAGGHPYKRDKLADFPNDLKIRQHPKP